MFLQELRQDGQNHAQRTVKEAIADYYSAIESRDANKIIHFFASNAQISFPGAGEHKGPESIRSFFEKFLFTQFSELHHTLLDTISSRSGVAARAVISGKVSNGKAFENIPYMEFLQFDDDLIVRSDICVDMPALRSQVGKW
jgi:ketosteroid isomerase-like protein